MPDVVTDHCEINMLTDDTLSAQLCGKGMNKNLLIELLGMSTWL